MIRKLTLAAGFGAGYVLGAKAGTQRYEQIVSKLRELSGKPAVQDVTANLSSTASAIGDTATSKVNETLSSVGDKVVGSGSSDVVDLSSSKSASQTGARATGPMPGAAASATAPDIAGV